MNKRENNECIIKELQSEVQMLEIMLQNQATIIGLKDMIIFRLNEKLKELEDSNEKINKQLTDPFWCFERSN